MCCIRKTSMRHGFLGLKISFVANKATSNFILRNNFCHSEYCFTRATNRRQYKWYGKAQPTKLAEPLASDIKPEQFEQIRSRLEREMFSPGI